METEETLKQRYTEHKSLFERACNNIREALTIFLSENKISYLTITSRVKDFDSFFEKIDRKHYEDPFAENEDFCGARVILYYLNDIENVKKLINQEFDVQENEDKSDKLDINEFGYRSYHFIVKFKEQWLQTPNYRGLKDIKIEIQVRTILMHAWAEIEHKLGYKNKEQVPNELKRKLFMISAKLEEADGQFQELKGNIDHYKKELIVDAGKKGKFSSQDFNLNAFQALMDFYFPDLEKHLVSAADLFLYIQKENIPVQTIVSYADKIKPLVPLIHSMIFGENTNHKTHQSNIMSYAIESLYPNADQNRASDSRKKVINKIKELLK